MGVKAIVLFILITVNPDNSLVEKATVIQSCPKKEWIIPVLEKELKEGKIKGYYANCVTVHMRFNEGNNT